MKNKQELSAEEIKEIVREIRKNCDEGLEEFCTELELMTHSFFGGRIYRNRNELKIYLPNKRKYRIVVEPISKDK